MIHCENYKHVQNIHSRNIHKFDYILSSAWELDTGTPQLLVTCTNWTWCKTYTGRDTPHSLTHLASLPKIPLLRTNLKASRTRLHIYRPSQKDLLGSNTSNPCTAFPALKCTYTFQQKAGQMDRIYLLPRDITTTTVAKLCLHGPCPNVKPAP